MENVEALLKQIDEDIKNVLSEKRYQHSLSVMKKAEELAIKYGVNVEEAKLVGLVHDIAKDVPKAEKLQYVKEHHIEIDDIEKVNVELLHAKIGANICKEKYKFTKEMQDAIQYHTVGNINMDDLAKVLFIADKTEDTRTYMDLKKVEEVRKKGIIDELIFLLDTSIEYTMKKGGLIHPDSIYTRNYFILNKK